MKKRVLLLVLAVVALSLALVSCGHEHSFQQTEVITAPTCDAAGKATFACECGQTEEREVAAVGHTFGEEIVQAPTCRHDGYTYQICTVCNAESEHKDVIKSDAKYHDFSEVKMTTPVDCGKQQNGIKETVCSACGQADPNGKKELVKWAHDYEEIKVEATCEAPGSIKLQCKNCQAPGQTTIIDQLPHTAEKVNSVAATCTTAGYDNYKCTVCNSTWTEDTSEMLGHEWAEEISWCEPTCTLPGYDYKACLRDGCNAQDVQPGEHGTAFGHDVDYNNADYTIVVAPTCITDGSITPICKRCNETLDTEVDLDGASYVKVVSATGVHYVTDEVISSKDATCHEAAYTEYKCTTDAACTATEKRHTGEKLDHTFVFIKTVAPLCYAPGYDLYVCSICETDTTESSTCELGCVEHRNPTTIDHKKSVLKSETAATCCDQAFEIWECADCSQEWTYTYSLEEKPLMAHGSWLKTDDVIAPTCTTEGYTIYTCQNDPDCVATDKQDYTRRTEHPFTEYIDGRLVCNVCNVTYRDITTYIDEAVDSGTLDIDGDTKLDWELKGYENPDEPTAIVVGTPFVYEVTGDALDISKGIIKLSSDAQATYTIVVECGAESVTYTVESANVFFDLYANEGVTKVTITATAAATVSLYAYEG